MTSCTDYRELSDAVRQTPPPEGAKVVLPADRGFDVVDLMAHCDRPGWKFRIRLKGSLNAFLRHLGCPVQGLLPERRGEALFVHSMHLTRRKAGPYHLALAKPKGLRETWMIAGNELTSAETFKEYGERFGIEENFPGDKSNGFGWEESRLRDPEAPGRLVLVLATAPPRLSLQGARVEAEGRRTEADPHWFRGLSYFKIGWNWIKRALEHGEKILQAWVFPKHFRPAPAQASRKQHQALLRQRSQRFRLREDTWDCGYLL